jgi:hypothetical protein
MGRRPAHQGHHGLQPRGPGARPGLQSRPPAPPCGCRGSRLPSHRCRASAARGSSTRRPSRWRYTVADHAHEPMDRSVKTERCHEMPAMCGIADGRSCTYSLRIIVSPRKPDTMPPLHHCARGQCDDSTLFLRPARGPGTPGAVCHIVLCVVPWRGYGRAEVNDAPHATP